MACLTSMVSGLPASAQMVADISSVVPSASALTLHAAETRLLAANRDLKRATREVERAQAATATAAARPNATLSVNTTDISPSRGIGPGSLADKRMDTVLRLEQTIERGDKRELRMAQADSQLDAVRADADDVRRQQLRALRLAYFDLKRSEDRLALLRQSKLLLDDMLVRAQVRVGAGDLAASDLERIRVDQLRAEADVRTAESDVRRAQSELARLLAMEAQTAQLHAVDPWPMPEAPLAPALPQDRPDLRAARLRLQAAQQGRSLAESLRTRDVTVGFQVERFPPEAGLMYGIGVSIPLFNGYDYSGEIAAAYAELGAAEDEGARIEVEAGAELQQRQADVEAASTQARRFIDVVLPSARRSADAAEFAFQHGASGVLDVLDARRTLRAIESESLAAQADYARARAELAAAQNRDF